MRTRRLRMHVGTSGRSRDTRCGQGWASFSHLFAKGGAVSRPAGFARGRTSRYAAGGPARCSTPDPATTPPNRYERNGRSTRTRLPAPLPSVPNGIARRRSQAIVLLTLTGSGRSGLSSDARAEQARSSPTPATEPPPTQGRRGRLGSGRPRLTGVVQGIRRGRSSTLGLAASGRQWAFVLVPWSIVQLAPRPRHAETGDARGQGRGGRHHIRCSLLVMVPECSADLWELGR